MKDTHTRAKHKARLFPCQAVVLLGLTLLLAAPASSRKLHPPWLEPPPGGVNFTVPGVDNVPDLHGDIHDPDLVIFFHGNQFMVLNDLLQAFKAAHPQVQKIYAETLPGGILREQARTGTLVMGNLIIRVKPDILTGGESSIQELQDKEGWFDRTVSYARNRLAIMVSKGNPKKVRTLEDLGRDEVRVSMPNPETEGIAQKAIEAYRKAGGQPLVDRIMEKKRQTGTTTITQIHHRETPMRLMENKSDAGPVWFSEVKFQRDIGNPIEMVEIPEKENVTSTFVAAKFKDAPHAQAAAAFLAFLESEQGRGIYEKHGFLLPP